MPRSEREGERDLGGREALGQIKQLGFVAPQRVCCSFGTTLSNLVCSTPEGLL